jgi:hypothetical protein
MRKIVDDPNEMPKERKTPAPETLVGKNAGPTGCVVMVRSDFPIYRAFDRRNDHLSTTVDRLKPSL